MLYVRSQERLVRWIVIILWFKTIATSRWRLIVTFSSHVWRRNNITTFKIIRKRCLKVLISNNIVGAFYKMTIPFRTNNIIINLIFLVWNNGLDAGLYQWLHPPLSIANLFPGIDLFEMVEFMRYAISDVAPITNLFLGKEWWILTLLGF